MRTIGFAGTAKNTGKTTAASAVLTAAHAAGLQVALTSIGYDGEAVDTVTGLPKPRYRLQAGVLVATTDRCLEAGTARGDILTRTGITTILGEIVLARIAEPGEVLLAGPNRRIDLEQVLNLLSAYDALLTLVDGALNRLVPLSAADGLVLSTGAALNRSPQQIALHAAALVEIFSLPVAPVSAATDTIQWVCRGGPQGAASGGSLIGEETCREVSAALPDHLQQITIPGACDPVWLARLFESHSRAFDGVQIVFGSPFSLVAGGDPLRWQDVFARVRAAGARPAVLATVPLLCLTVNPFFPRYDPHTGRYEPARVDASALLQAVHAAVPSLPVLDVCQPDPPDLLDIIGISTKESNG